MFNIWGAGTTLCIPWHYRNLNVIVLKIIFLHIYNVPWSALFFLRVVNQGAGGSRVSVERSPTSAQWVWEGWMTFPMWPVCSLRFKSLAVTWTSLFTPTCNDFSKTWPPPVSNTPQKADSEALGCGASWSLPGEMMIKLIKPFNIKLWLNDCAPASLITQCTKCSRHLLLSLSLFLLASWEIQMFVLSWDQVGSQVTGCKHVNLKPFCDKRPQIRQYLNA